LFDVDRVRAGSAALGHPAADQVRFGHEKVMRLQSRLSDEDVERIDGVRGLEIRAVMGREPRHLSRLDGEILRSTPPAATGGAGRDRAAETARVRHPATPPHIR